MNKAYSKIVEEELMKILTEEKEDGSFAAFAIPNKHGIAIGKTNLLRTNGNKGEHDIKNYFQFHGFPYWWQEQQS